MIEIEDFKPIYVRSNYYELYPDDKTVLLFAIKPTSVKIQESNKFTPDGEPVYFVSTQQFITLSNMSEGFVDNISVDSFDLEQVAVENNSENDNN